MMLDELLKPALLERQQQNRYRQRLVLSTCQGEQVTSGSQSFLSFCNNDYLGLANHPEVITALQRAAASAGVGSKASHLVCGHSDYHHQLEEAIARFTGRERALLFSTGYMANLGVISALLKRGDSIYEDRLNHASLIDGGILSRAHFKRFRHNDIQHLQTQLDGKSRLQLVVVDGVFSMDGDIAPLPELANVCLNNKAHLMVDDAHGFGVLGEHGGGCAEHFGLSSQELPILVGTLGKAFGTFGAFVAGSEALIETLIQFARPYIYTTALPPSVAAATLTSLRLVQQDDWRRQHLQRLIQQFRLEAERLGLPLMPSVTPIQPIVIGEDGLVVQVAKQLGEQGLLISAIRPPTVPEGTARLRITFSAAHSEAEVDRLLSALDRAIPFSIRQ